MKYFFVSIIIIVIVAAIALYINLSDSAKKTIHPSHELLGSSLDEAKVKITYFWSVTCPHCRKQNEFWQDFVERYPEVAILKYSVDKPENVRLLKEMAQELNVGRYAGSIPITFIGEKFFLGFDGPDGVGKQIEETVQEKILQK